MFLCGVEVRVSWKGLEREEKEGGREREDIDIGRPNCTYIVGFQVVGRRARTNL